METHFVFPWNSILYFHGHTIPANICTQLMKWYQIVLENEDKCFAGLTFSSRGGEVGTWNKFTLVGKTSTAFLVGDHGTTFCISMETQFQQYKMCFHDNSKYVSMKSEFSVVQK